MFGGIYQHVLDSIGPAIVRGELPTGRVLTIDSIVVDTGASRSIVREASRVLVAHGMIRARRRVGLEVLPPGRWDLLDTDVIRWRLDSPFRATQLAELRDVRCAIEPEAARLAAQRHSLSDATGLVEAVDAMDTAARSRTGDDFLAADRRFHGLILSSSGNGMLERLRSVIDQALAEQTPQKPERWLAAGGDVELHRMVANAISGSRPGAAANAMRRIVNADNAP